MNLDFIKERIKDPRMEYYRSVYKNSVMWNGKSDLKDKTVCVYCEQGIGDIIQLLRYIPVIKELGCKIILHCPQILHCLIPYVCNDIQLIDKNDPNIPKHDFHILTMSLPFFVKKSKSCPYINIKEKVDISSYKGFKIGICWEGGPLYEKNSARNCPLINFKSLHDLPDVCLFSLKKEFHDQNLLLGCENFFVYGININNFVDTASLINSVDLVVSVDTSVLHLAGAMNKPTFALLSNEHDPRWIINWYPSVKLFFQKENWSKLLDEISFEILNTKLCK